jgi:hypothetical protein
MISVSKPRNIEKTDTPTTRINVPISLSESLLGAKSPKPTVDKVVKAKYMPKIAL